MPEPDPTASVVGASSYTTNQGEHMNFESDIVVHTTPEGDQREVSVWGLYFEGQNDGKGYVMFESWGVCAVDTYHPADNELATHNFGPYKGDVLLHSGGMNPATFKPCVYDYRIGHYTKIDGDKFEDGATIEEVYAAIHM